jgi:eukaryotic-like serine/threonine-protein kinase
VRSGTLFADRFEIEWRAGLGGMGTIYRALDRTTGKPVALKVMTADLADPQRAERFLREGRVLGELEHPGIVHYLAHGTTHDGERFLAMEWLEGEDLSARLRAGPLGVNATLTLGLRAAQALAAAHSAGIVHRDVKPSNLFLVDGDVDRVKLLDFGVARRSAGSDVTRTGVRIGTPSYMAPEQVRGVRNLDARADLFALGGVLFTTLTGRHPFPGDDEIAVCVKVLLEEAPRVRELRDDVPAAVDHYLAKLMAKDPADRPADGSAVALQLAAFLRGELASEAPRPGTTLTSGEQRVLSVLLVRPASPDDAPTRIVHADSTGGGDGTAPSLVRRHNGHLEQLPDGSSVVTLDDAAGAAATDQAAQAAKLALALRDMMPGAAIALATGRGVMAGSRLVGDVVDRAARVLRRVAERPADELRPIALDEASAGLLDAQFQVGGDAGGLWLHGHRASTEVVRLLLGKPTPCLGRERELATLDAILAECTGDEVARAVIVTALPGLGKSRLRYEFLRRAHARQPMEIWLGRADAISAGAPLALITSALRRTCGILDDEPLAVQQQRLRARIGRNLPAGDATRRTTEFIGELISVPFRDEDSVQLRSARLDPVLMADQMLTAWQAFVAAEADVRPVVLVLEDLHWGDVGTVKYIDAALRNLGDKRLLVLALARPEIHEQFPRLWSGRGVTEIQLAELSPKASERLVREVLPDAPAELVARLCKLAAGNAFYLEELIRAARSGEVTTFPETVLAMVQGRLEALPAAARRVLRAASIFGDAFWRGGVTALCGDDAGSVVGEALKTLDEAELIQRRADQRFAAEEEYAFRHAIVREAAYAALTEKDRVLGHRLAGAWLENAGERVAVTMAEHFERGEEPARALVWYQRAAEQALGSNDLEAAVKRAQRGIACGATGEALGVLRLILAEAHTWLGHLAEGETWGLAAMELLPRGSASWWKAASEVAFCAGNRANYEGLVTLVETMRVAGAHGDGSMRARVVASARAVAVLFPAGRFDLARSLLEDIEPIADGIVAGDPAVAGSLHWARGWRATYRKDLAQALSHRRAAAQCFAEAGDRRSQTHQLSMVGSVYNKVGCHAEAVEVLRPAREAAQQLGIANVLAQVDNNLGFALCALGALDEGLAIEEEAVQLFHAVQNRRLEAGSRGYLARYLKVAGRLDDAEREARTAVELAETTPPTLAHLLAMLASVHLAQGKHEVALREAEEGHRMLEALGGLDEGEALVRLVLAEALAANDRQAEAVVAIREAKERLLARAAPINDPLLGQAFVENVADNVRTLALAARWGA